MAIGIDDEAAISLTRLFNEPAGLEYLAAAGVDDTTIDHLPLMGISGAANLLAAIKVAKHYEMTEKDVVMTVATDSMEMYGSRLAELTEDRGRSTRRRRRCPPALPARHRVSTMCMSSGITTGNESTT